MSEGDHTETRETQWLEEAKGSSAPAPAQPQPAARSKDTGPVLPALGMKLVETAFRGKERRPDPDGDIFDAANFKQVKNSWWLDRLLPDGARKYFLAAYVICTGVWLIALVLRLMEAGTGELSEDLWYFVKDKQWQLQPLLLFVHFICLRLFKGIYSRNFDRAFTHLDVQQGELETFKRWFYGRRVNLFAIAIALPFIAWDFLFFATGEKFYETIYGADSRYLQIIDTSTRTAEAWLLLTIWTFEWLMFGFYCYLMLSGAFVVRAILRKHDFVDSVDLVLTERQYRPMFNVIAQAGSLVFFYGLIHLGYMLYTKSADSDIAGLILLVTLLSTSFGITWGAVRAELRGNVNAALEELEKSYRSCREKLATMKDIPGIDDDIQRIQVQLKMQLALQQLDYLQSKYESLGRREFLGLVFKMLAPVGSVLARIIRWGSLLAAIGLGSAAALGVSERQPANVGTEAEAPANAGE
ncbi:MAG: hypothetical protein KF696_12310 [Planctomycetes bacterium]|nr:hypothetical protein [Planctomycetota bacterium]MCW8136582.1 hypothetical protein [Planctomycetota bacterium]